MQLLTKKQAAERLQISERTLDRYRSERLIKAIRSRGAVRFHPHELDRYAAKFSS